MTNDVPERSVLIQDSYNQGRQRAFLAPTTYWLSRR